MPDPIALRVARRHAREAAVVLRNGPAEKTRVEYTDSGRISAAELTRKLEPRVGPLARMVFHRPPGGPPNEVGWAAVDPAGGVVSGTLKIRTNLSGNMVTTWAEATIDPPGHSIVIDPADLRLVSPATTTSAAARVALRHMRRTEGLVPVEDEEGQGSGDGEERSNATPQRPDSIVNVRVLRTTWSGLAPWPR
jgi:hypothetical protein